MNDKRGLDKIIKIFERRVNDKDLSLDPNIPWFSSSQKARALRNQRKRAIDLETLEYLKELKQLKEHSHE